MKIYRGKINPISEDVVKKLIEEEDVEISEDQVPEVILDNEAIIREYLRMEEEISTQARDLIQAKGMSYQEFGKLRRMIAEEKGFETGDKSLLWIANQIIECFLINSRVEEVFTEDYTLRKKIAAVFSEHLGIEEQVQKEAKEKIKNLTEGTPEWELEYQKHYRQIARRKGLL